MKYISFIPLIGGMAIANEQATGKKPEFVISYKNFEKNESNLKHYWPDVEWKLLDAETNTMEDEPEYSDIDFVSSVCPCAGMSMMSSTRSADSAVNEWLYKSSDYILGTIKPKVYFGENAPGLYSDTNIKVANRLRELGKKYGYAFTIYKTDTQLHGIPQRRVRTFFFFWKGEHCPEMEYYCNVPEKPFEEWILDKNTGTHSDTPGLADIENAYPEFKWILETRCNGKYEEFIKLFYDLYDSGSRVAAMTSYITKYGLWDEYIDWLEKNGYGESANSKKKTPLDIAKYRKDKIEKGLNFFTNEVLVYKDYTGAITGKTLGAIFHPKELRTLTLRESMELMGLPKDFEVTSGVQAHITQNVPVCTAKDMTEQVIKFCNSELPMTEYSYIKQNNLTQKINHKE